MEQVLKLVLCAAVNFLTRRKQNVQAGILGDGLERKRKGTSKVKGERRGENE